MDTLTMAFNAIAIQSLRKSLYIASTIPALVNLIAGTLAIQTDQWMLIIVTSVYFCTCALTDE